MRCGVEIGGKVAETTIQLARFVAEAADGEARWWLERISPHDIFRRSLPGGGIELFTGAGIVLSRVHVEAAGYLLTVHVDRVEV